MRVEIGTHVVTSDGEDMGTIRYLILDSASHQIHSVVAERGLLLKRDVEIDLGRLGEYTLEGVRLNMTAEEAEQLPPFIATRYEHPPDHVADGHDYPAAGLLWPAPIPGGGFPPFPPLVVMTERDSANGSESDDEAVPLPGSPELAVISEGSEVFSRDGNTVGVVHQVAFDGVSGRPLSIVVRRGVLFHTDVVLPAECIASVENQMVFLTMDSEKLEDLVREPAGIAG